MNTSAYNRAIVVVPCYKSGRFYLFWRKSGHFYLFLWRTHTCVYKNRFKSFYYCLVFVIIMAWNRLFYTVFRVKQLYRVKIGKPDNKKVSVFRHIWRLAVKKWVFFATFEDWPLKKWVFFATFEGRFFNQALITAFENGWK